MATLKQLYKFFDGTCQYCFKKIPLKDACKDHLMPNSKLTGDFSNLTLVCKTCNVPQHQYKIPIKPLSLFPDIKAIVKENKELKKKIKALEWSLYHAD